MVNFLSLFPPPAGCIVNSNLIRSVSSKFDLLKVEDKLFVADLKVFIGV